MINQLDNVFSALEGHPGFHADLHLAEAELDELRALVTAQYQENMLALMPTERTLVRETPIESYHLLSPRIVHESSWPKARRILPNDAVKKIRTLPFFGKLEQTFGDIAISNEEGLRPEEIYWRIARPSAESDAAPVHADKWFWDLGHGEHAPDKTRVKIWIALHTEPGASGLLFYSDSHLRDDWRYHSVSLDGIKKPRIDSDVSQLDAQMHGDTPGQCLIFHDAILHAGKVNAGRHTRVNLEFTMLIDSDRF